MSYPPGSMAISAKIGLVIIAAVTIAGVGYFFIKDDSAPTGLRELPTVAPAQQVATPVARPIDKPVYDEPKDVPQAEPLPDLNDSDTSVIGALRALNINGLVEMIIPEEILRKFVRAVDAVEDGKVVTEYRPIASPQGAFVADSFHVKVAGGEIGESEEVEQFRVSPKNYMRYTLFVQVMSGLDSDAAIAVYKRFYPLLNKAYQEMGLNKGNFHSVLIRAIDNVLAAPAATGDMILVRPKVYYEFADPALEKLPATHKLMLRMGSNNEQSIKQSLKSIRSKLI